MLYILMLMAGVLFWDLEFGILKYINRLVNQKFFDLILRHFRTNKFNRLRIVDFIEIA
jgi:hypothetical protein